MTDISGTLTSFLTEMLGLSIACERVTETIKQWITIDPVTIAEASKRTWIVQAVAIASGVVVVGLSGLNPLEVPRFEPFQPARWEDWLCWVVTGLLVSGGSAIWNHLLDIVKASKVQKELSADTKIAATGKAPIPS